MQTFIDLACFLSFFFLFFFSIMHELNVNGQEKTGRGKGEGYIHDRLFL